MNDKRETVQACKDDLDVYLRDLMCGVTPNAEVAIDSLAGAAHALVDDEHKLVIVCTCSRAVICTVVGGMYPQVYAGYCDSCERRWSLEWGK